MSKIKIYGWDNSPGNHDWHTGIAMAEDGTVVASHMSSSHGWSRHDMTYMHRSDYVAKYGEEGFEFIWLEDPKSDAGWLAATALNEKQREAATSVQAAAGE